MLSVVFLLILVRRIKGGDFPFDACTYGEISKLFGVELTSLIGLEMSNFLHFLVLAKV